MNGDIFILICLRGVKGKDYERIYTQGGGIDYEETAEQAAVREAFEESGLTIEENQLRVLSQTPPFADFYVIFDNFFPEVAGPLEECRWEVITNDKLGEMFNVPMIKDSKDRNTGLAWVNLSVVFDRVKDMDYKLPRMIEKILIELHKN
jgi:8-oxo-dGTP pyrophosphatase MutT (NUDIX family)